jgi:epoxyqueuosine reductase
VTPTYADIRAAARAVYLDTIAGLHPGPADNAPPDTGTLLLLGPHEPAFWGAFAASPEYGDGLPDPMDRWSRRVIGALATALGGTAIFPFDGPPWAPFIRWALASGQVWTSPVGLLVHGRAGLWLSFRGAIGLADRITLPETGANPCNACQTRPCLTACPVGALGTAAYDPEACHGWLASSAGDDCMAMGCAVRRACPAGAGHGRMREQSAFHMAAFHIGKRPRCTD